MKLAVVFGTRPEIIKLSSIIKIAKPVIINTNQHFSKNMNEDFIKELRLPRSHYNIDGMDKMVPVRRLGYMIERIGALLIETKPDCVVVQGDTDSALAGALAARKCDIRIAHIEAGLRSKERMQEETNRILIDHMTDYLFPPTRIANHNLIKEGLVSGWIVGNTVVDAVNAYRPKRAKKSSHVLVTIHRAENVDNIKRFSSILRAIDKVKGRVIYPIHPRSSKKMQQFGLKTKAELIEPVKYKKMLELIYDAKWVMTDSGGLQEEACILKTPCITMRKATERPETIDVGANILWGSKGKIKASWDNPYGDGKSGKRIIDILYTIHEQREKKRVDG
jgi:UDP-N-acetylglucosamine 2-epimerase (non-hydrolysing)